MYKQKLLYSLFISTSAAANLAPALPFTQKLNINFFCAQ